MLDPSNWIVIDWPTDIQPMLVVAVDTEAEFDWVLHGSRRASGVSSVKSQAQVQPIFERYGVRPTYIVDYPVSSTPEGYEYIRELHQSGACEIGAHLQPWDTPPFVEQVTELNSYPGNLPLDIEKTKLIRLTEAIQQNIGVQPRIYKAGRYGVGPATAGILADLGYQIDLSVVPGTDLRGEFGPDFSHCGSRPYWFGSRPPLLEIPLTIGYTGLLARIGNVTRILTTNRRLKTFHVPGVLARLRLLDRITLTPEGVTFGEQRRLTRALLRRGHRVFSFSYHSPSLAPGNTPYVRDREDLDEFLRRIDEYLAFFVGEIGGRAVTPFEVRELAKQSLAGKSATASARPQPG